MFWLDDLKTHFDAKLRDGGLPHAVMLTGRRGLGKQRLAHQIAGSALNVTLSNATEEVEIRLAEMPDYHHLTPMPDKTSISVDQVRELTTALSLSAHSGKKVAIVETADAMTVAAANALLKTLEEPSGDSLLILIANDLSRIPATIISRCAPYRIPVPDRRQSIDWLAGYGHNTSDANQALDLYVGAPVAAKTALEDGSFAAMQIVRDGVGDLLAGTRQPLAVAGSLKKVPTDLVFRALRAVVEQLIYPENAGMRSKSDFRRYVMDSRDAFCYLDTLNRILVRPRGSFNAEIAVEQLLIPWSAGLTGYYEKAATRPTH
ncbi:MAG: AAA family ATPase [Woeseiaceae bacterium]